MSGVFPGADAGVCASIGYELWFPDPGESDRTAKQICRTCPAINECLTYALDIKVKGVWGGTNETDREALRRTLGIKGRPMQREVA